MKRLVVGLVAAAVVMTAAAPAFADPPHHRGKYGYSDRHDRGRDRHDRDYDNWDDRRDERQSYREGYRDGYRYDRHDDWRRGYNNDWRYDRYTGYSDRGYSDWRRSDRYDRHVQVYRYRPGYYLPNYARYPVVHDYYGRRLPPPGRGQYYVDCDGDILLIAAATGLIVWALGQ